MLNCDDIKLRSFQQHNLINRKKATKIRTSQCGDKRFALLSTRLRNGYPRICDDRSDSRTG